MSRSIDISETHKEIVQAILREHLTNTYRVWVFGSRATWLAKEYSDLDLAIARKDGSALSLTVTSALETAFEDSLLPWKVDVVDLHSVSAEFRSAIERDKVLFSLGVGGWRKSRWGNEISLEYGKSLKGYRNGTGKFQVFGSNGPVGWTDTALTQGPGVVLGRKGAYRGVEFSKSSFYVIDTAYFIKLKSNLDMRWVYYSIKHHKLGEIDDGSPIPSTTRSAVYVCNLNVPELIEQKAIAHILGTLDDKIELNRQTNQTLEAMAQALFQSWFVDFDPVIDKALAAGNEIPEAFQAKAAARQALGDQRLALPEDVTALFPDAFVFTEEMGWVPEGWEVSNLDSITIELRRGISPKYIDTGGVRVINQKCIRDHFINFSLTRRHDPTKKNISDRELIVGDMLINSTGVGTLGRMAQVISLDEATVVDSHVTVVRSNNKVYKPYAFARMLFELEPKIEAMGEGSTGQTELSRSNLQKILIIIPSMQCQNAIEEVLFKTTQKIASNLNNNEVLTTIRDTLLPKLISGELRVADAEKFMEKV